MDNGSDMPAGIANPFVGNFSAAAGARCSSGCHADRHFEFWHAANRQADDKAEHRCFG